MRIDPLQEPLDRQRSASTPIRNALSCSGTAARRRRAFARGVALDPLEAAPSARQRALRRPWRDSRLEGVASRCASAGLSMTTPISVLSRAERGSKLNEPTKIRAAVDREGLRVQAGATSCPDARLRSLAVGLARRRLELVEPHAGAQQRRAALRIAGVHGADVGRGERVGQHAHRARRARQRGERGGAARARHEVGRHEVERRAPARRSPAAARRAAAGRCRSAVSSVLAGSSRTTLRVAHSSGSSPASSSRTSGVSRTASM